MTGDLKISRNGDAQIFSLNRPASGNSLTPALVEALHDALDAFDRDGARVLVLTGEGRNFCTGFDLGNIAETTDADLLLRFVRIEQLLARLWTAPYATIVVGKGRVVGAGADLFAACAQRIALDGAAFSFPGAAFGLILGTRRLALRIGEAETQRLVTSGAAISAETAAQMGLATIHIAADELPSRLDQEVQLATRLDVTTFGAIRKAIGGVTGQLDSDLATLVRSAARTGLRERIIAFRARSLSESRLR